MIDLDMIAKLKSSEDAHDLGDFLIVFLMKAECPTNIAQAALGSSWYRMCRAMGFSLQEFSEICDELKIQYKEDWGDGQ